MGWLENVIVEDKALENERFEVTDTNSLYFLGPNLTLRGCTVVTRVPAKRLHIRGVRFLDCTFEVKQELKNHQDWIGASLKGCRFKGRLSGCDFGHWPEYGSEPEYQLGAIEDCDFSAAQLNACRFMGCDVSTLRLPRWPCFTFLEPIRRAAELRAAPWPALFGRVVMGDLHNDPPRTVAVTYHAPSVAKQMETTPEALRAVLEQLAGVVI